MIKWLYNNYAITGAISLYFLCLVGYGTHAVFNDITQITGPAAAAYATLLGLPAVAIALLKWRIERAS